MGMIWQERKRQNDKQIRELLAESRRLTTHWNRSAKNIDFIRETLLVFRFVAPG
jgi:hypothetical protein